MLISDLEHCCRLGSAGLGNGVECNGFARSNLCKTRCEEKAGWGQRSYETTLQTLLGLWQPGGSAGAQLSCWRSQRWTGMGRPLCHRVAWSLVREQPKKRPLVPRLRTLKELPGGGYQPFTLHSMFLLKGHLSGTSPCLL